MKTIFTLLPFIFTLLFTLNLDGQTVWTGEPITFTKEDFADWNLAENQDRITDNVWITRKNTQGIFNIATEDGFETIVSPADTEWAFGTTSDDLSSLAFDTWENLSLSQPPALLNQDLVLHLITDDIYLDLKFISWTRGNEGGGGGFSYVRSTNNMSTNNVDKTEALNLYPNPVKEGLSISGLKKAQTFAIFSSNGKLLRKGSIGDDEQISVGNLTKGVYFIKLENGKTLKFTKK